MQQPDPPGPGAPGYGPPVHRARNRRREPADHPGGDHVVRRSGPVGGIAHEIDDVEHDRRGEKPQREDDEHRVDRMPQELDSALHTRTPRNESACPIMLRRGSGGM